MNLNHPTKELVWVIKNMAFTGDDKAGHANHGHPFLAYADNEIRWETVALQEAANNIAAGMFRITPCIGVAPPNLAVICYVLPLVFLYVVHVLSLIYPPVQSMYVVLMFSQLVRMRKIISTFCDTPLSSGDQERMELSSTMLIS